MSDEQSPDAAETASASAVDTDAGTAPDLPEEWKPEPRQWGWKDVFTAPMLAFKPKCMAIAVLTVLALLGWDWLAGKIGGQIGSWYLIGEVWTWAYIAVTAVIFAIGASFISIFFKADLLEDEFLSCKEAWAIFKGRLGSAIMVPLFLVLVVAGAQLLLWLAHLVAALPIVGPVLYALLFPLGFLLALLIVLLSIGALLAIFVGPAVIAVRKHGWFDNVIDTFEAVGTKPHKLIFCLVLTLIMVQVGFAIPRYALDRVASPAVAPDPSVYSLEVARAEVGAAEIKEAYLGGLLEMGPLALIPGIPFDSDVGMAYNTTPDRARAALVDDAGARIEALQDRITELNTELNATETPESRDNLRKEIEAHQEELAAVRANPAHVSGYHKWGPGLVLHFWQVLLGAAILGYAINVLLAGGMLTYLAVREDDYWDDEDLEDLDKLTKELEEEAKREEEAAKAPAEAKATAAEDAKAAAPEAKPEAAPEPEEPKPEAGDTPTDGETKPEDEKKD